MLAAKDMLAQVVKREASWRGNFDERQLKEIDFCIVYKKQFCHGTDGHNIRIIVADMASILDSCSQVVSSDE